MRKKSKQKDPLDMNKKFLELFGWYGVLAYIGTYALVSFHIWSVDDFIYQFANFTGALGLGIVSLKKKAYQPAVSNFLWSAIALIALGIIIYKNYLA